MVNRPPMYTYTYAAYLPSNFLLRKSTHSWTVFLFVRLDPRNGRSERNTPRNPERLPIRMTNRAKFHTRPVPVTYSYHGEGSCFSAIEEKSRRKPGISRSLRISGTVRSRRIIADSARIVWIVAVKSEYSVTNAIRYLTFATGS